jgi:hypothetical protein
MGWGRIEVVVELLAIFTMVSFMSSDAEEALLEHGVNTIPKPQAKTETLVVIAKTRETIFSPSVCTRTGMCMREMRPGIAVCRVIFTDSGLRWWVRTELMKKGERRKIAYPLSFWEIRAPSFPVTLSALILSEAVAFDAFILGLELRGETVAIVLGSRLYTSRTRGFGGLVDLLLRLD